MHFQEEKETKCFLGSIRFIVHVPCSMLNLTTVSCMIKLKLLAQRLEL